MTRRLVRTADILDGHVGLDLECLDRIYLNGYVPNLQLGGQVVQFLALRGFPIPSPVVVGRIGDQFRRLVRSFADTNSIPVIKFARATEDRHDEAVSGPSGAVGRSGVAAIGWAQEFQRVATCTTTEARGGGAPHFGWAGPIGGSPATTSTSGTRRLGCVPDDVNDVGVMTGASPTPTGGPTQTLTLGPVHVDIPGTTSIQGLPVPGSWGAGTGEPSGSVRPALC